MKAIRLDAQRVEELTAWVQANPERAACELLARRETPQPTPDKPEPKQLGELLVAHHQNFFLDSTHGRTHNGDGMLSNNSTAVHLGAAVRCTGQNHARKLLQQRIKRQQLEAWVEQERQPGEVCDAGIYKDQKVWATRYFAGQMPHDYGAILMPVRLADLLCKNLNSGGWVL